MNGLGNLAVEEEGVFQMTSNGLVDMEGNAALMPGDEGYAPVGDELKPGDEGYVAPAGDELKPGDEGYVAPTGDELKPGDEGYVAPAGDVTVTDDQFLSYFNEKSEGTFKNIDQIKAALTANADLEKQVSSYKERENSFKNPLEENEEMAKLHNFITETKLGIKEYTALNGTDISTMDAIDKMILHSVITDPSLKGKESLLRESLERKYDISDPDSEDYQLNKFEVEQASKVAESKLLELQGKITKPDFEAQRAQSSQEAEAVRVKNEQDWGSSVPTVVNDFKDFPVYATIEDAKGGKEPVTNIPISDELRAEYRENIAEYVKENGLPNTPEAISHVKAVMHQDFITKNYLQIANALADKRVEARDKVWEERTGQSFAKAKERFEESGNGDLSDNEKHNQNQENAAMKGYN